MNLLQKALLAVSAVVYLGSRIICGQTTNSTLACSAAKNCEKCVEDSKCFWCETTLLCNDYGVENEKVETKKCDRWKWKTCGNAETSLIAIVSGCTSVVLISSKFFFFFSPRSCVDESCNLHCFCRAQFEFSYLRQVLQKLKQYSVEKLLELHL